MQLILPSLVSDGKLVWNIARMKGKHGLEGEIGSVLLITVTTETAGHVWTSIERMEDKTTSQYAHLSMLNACLR